MKGEKEALKRGTGHGNDAGSGTSSSGRYIPTFDKHQRLNRIHAEQAFAQKTDLYSTLHKRPGAAMPVPGSGRDSRRGSRSGGESGLRTAARTEKAKSSHGHAGGASAGPRPSLGTRTSSAPLVERRRGSGYAAGMQRLPPSQEHVDQAGTGAVEPGQDEDEAAGVVGAMRQYEPFRSPQVCARQYPRPCMIACMLTT